MSIVSISAVQMDKLRILLNEIEGPHEHREGANECHICDEPVIDAAIRLLTDLKAKADTVPNLVSALKGVLNHDELHLHMYHMNVELGHDDDDMAALYAARDTLAKVEQL